MLQLLSSATGGLLMVGTPSLLFFSTSSIPMPVKVLTCSMAMATGLGSVYFYHKASRSFVEKLELTRDKDALVFHTLSLMSSEKKQKVEIEHLKWAEGAPVFMLEDARDNGRKVLDA